MEELKLAQIENIIKTRKSVKRYQNDWDDRELINKISSFCDVINNTEGPFGTKINVQIINRDIGLKQISGANNCLIASVDMGNYNLFDIGYLFEKVILYVTSLNLGSILIDATHNREIFKDKFNQQGNYKIMLVCPFGQEDFKKSKLRNIISKSEKNEKFEKLFFDIDMNSVDVTLCGDYIKVLEAIRLAPSTLNKQSTRLVSDPHKGRYYFYSAIDKGNSDINIGVALCHFELMMNEQFIFGEIINTNESALPNYKFTWKEIR